MPRAVGFDGFGPNPHFRFPHIPSRMTAVVLTVAVVLSGFVLGLGLPGAAAPAQSLGYPGVSGAQATAAANSWTNLTAATAPSPRSNPLMAYDSLNGRAFLFGGWGAWPSYTPFNDTWSYDPATNRWTNLTPSTHPELYGNPLSAAMVYDSQAGRILLFGGCQAQPCWGPDETWSYDPNANTWTLMQPAASPYAGQWLGLTYDSQADRVLLFGVQSFAPDCQCSSNRTWVYDYGADNWTFREPSTGPSGRAGVGMAYDPTADRTLIFGGCISGMTCTATNETWSYDYGADAWTNMTPASSPPAAFNLPMVYDNVSDHFILFGEGGNQTWSYNFTTNAWVDQRPATSPPARFGPGIVYDAATPQTILFGGYGPSVLNDTWSYTFGAATTSPPLAPRSLVATTGSTSNNQNQVTLTWQPPADNGGYAITGYRVYRGTTSGGETFLVSPGNTLSYVDQGVATLTTYFYQVSAVNALGEGPRSGEASATPPDLTPPTVVMTYPTEGATLTSTTITASGTASDDVAIQQVDVSVNDGSWYPASGTASWSAPVTLVPGDNVIAVRATDTSANIGWGGANVTVTTSPPPDVTKPTVAWTYPTEGATLTATTVTVRGTAEDDVAVQKVELSVNRGSWYLATGTTSWSATVSLVPGANLIEVRATDPSGNVGLAELNVTVSTTSNGTGGQGSGGSGGTVATGLPMEWVAVGILVAAVAAVGIVSWWRMRRKREPGPPT